MTNFISPYYSSCNTLTLAVRVKWILKNIPRPKVTN